MSLWVAHRLKGRSGNQLGGRRTSNMPRLLAWGRRAGVSPIMGKCSLSFLPLFLCHEIIPQGTPLLPMAVSLFLGHAGSTPY